MTEEQNKDPMDALILDLADNLDILESMMAIMKRLKEAGIIDLLNHLSKDYMPTDIEFLGKFFTSREFSVSLLKTLNVLTAVMFAVSDEKNSDMLKTLMFNSPGISDTLKDYTSPDSKLSILSMYEKMKNPDVVAGMNAMLGILRFLGHIIRTQQ